MFEKRFIKGPSSNEEWIEKAGQFKRKLDFGNILGVIDGSKY